VTNPEDPNAPAEQPPPPYGAPPPPAPPPPYGAPPPPPGYGTPPPAYGAPPPAYGAPPPGYGAAPYGAPPPGYSGGPELASWGARVQSALVDWFLPFVVAGVAYQVSTGLGVLLYLAALAWVFYNRYLEGTTGQSVGKKMAGTRLVRAQDGQLVGAGLAIGRAFVHVVDGLPCYLGYLWPLWDKQKQTFADKILGTLVIKA
jgi:uncharacterized RDD family membrane protein YckC